MRTIAIILAGGSGNRLGSDAPKQFLKVAGKEIIEYTIDTFEKCNAIDEICIVSRADYVSHIEELVELNHFEKVKKIVPGGKERYHSSLAALDAYTDDDTNLLFHDAVRPLVSERIINDCVSALQNYNAVGVATPTTDTILEIGDDNCITNIPNRNQLRNAQTPQGFKRWVIRKAYDIALADEHFQTTDDCGVVKKYLPSEKIYIINGENTNIKITYKEDIELLEKLCTSTKDNAR